MPLTLLLLLSDARRIFHWHVFIMDVVRFATLQQKRHIVCQRSGGLLDFLFGSPWCHSDHHTGGNIGG